MLLWLLLLPLCLGETNWPSLSERADQAARAERDIGLDIPLDQQTPFGISANRLIFDVQGYSTDTLTTLHTVLSTGVNALMLDIYWNQFTNLWQLCPAPIPSTATTNTSEVVEVTWEGNSYQCQPKFGDADVFSTLRDYLKSSNINSEANIVQVILNLREIAIPASVIRSNYTNSTWESSSASLASLSAVPQYMEIGNSSLSTSMNILSSYLFTPKEMSSFNNTMSYDDEYPTASDFLYSLYKRTFVSAITTDLGNTSRTYNVTDTDTEAIFFYDSYEFTLNTTTDLVLADCLLRRTASYDTNYYSNRVLDTRFRTLIDNDSSKFTPMKAYEVLQCGYTPILNATSYSISNRTNLTGEYTGRVIDQYIPFANWGWGPYEPNTTFTNETRQALKDDDYTPNKDEDDPDWQEVAESQVAEKCVVIKQSGWAVYNCYSKYRLACKSKTNSFEWTLSDSIMLYFSTDSDEVCPKNYEFGVPHLSTEHLALLNFLNSTNVSYPVWIDMNDITILGCYVSGGPYAACPYKRAVSTSNLIRLIAPSAVVAVVILILIFFERFFLLTPIHSNRRRYWKRRINQHYKKNDYEGVPL